MNSVAGERCLQLRTAQRRSASSNRTRATGPRVRAGDVADRDGSRRLVSIEDVARLHLVPVVILGVDPEHGNGGHVMLGPHAFGEAAGPSAP